MKFIGKILSIIILSVFLTAIFSNHTCHDVGEHFSANENCHHHDHCGDNQNSNQSDESHKNSQEPCSPFCDCIDCHHIIFSISFLNDELKNQLPEAEISFFFKETYTFNTGTKFWHPPRLA